MTPAPLLSLRGSSLLALAAGLAAASPGAVDPVSAQAGEEVLAAVLGDSIRVGDVVPVALRTTVTPGQRVLWPDTLDLGGPGAEVENAARVRVREDTLADGRLQVTGVYAVIPWRPGEVALPDVAIRVVAGDEVARELTATPPPFEVLSVLLLAALIAGVVIANNVAGVPFSMPADTTNPEIRSFLDENIARFNGRPGDSESFNALDQLMGQQHYRLSFWKVASEEINYRRFFNINELISLRVEDANVFETCHRLIFQLIRESKISGIRIDHIDGLKDPQAYLDKLPPVYVIVEKILAQQPRIVGRVAIEQVRRELDAFADRTAEQFYRFAKAGSFDEFVDNAVETNQNLANLYTGIEYVRHIAGEKHLIYK